MPWDGEREGEKEGEGGREGEGEGVCIWATEQS
jgi:hypothetical protein